MDTARELVDRLASLYRNERDAMADFLVALAAFDERKAWRDIGYASLWSFLRHELRLSKSAAFHRKTAAELIQVYPAVAEALRSGQLCLTTVAELGRVLTPENVGVVLPQFFGLSAREAEAVSVSLRPAQVIPTRDVVRLLPSAPSGLSPAAAPASSPASDVDPVVRSAAVPEPALSLPRVVPASELQPPTRAAPRPEPRPSTAFLDAERARLSVTIPRRVLDKLEAARDALAHVIPDGDLAGVLEHALDLVLAETKKKRAQVEKPRKASKPPKNGRATSLPRWPARSGRDPGGGVSARCRTVNGARPPAPSRSTTCNRSRAGASRPWRTSGSPAAAATCSLRGGPSATR